MKKNNLCLIPRHLLILIEKIPNAMKLTFLFLVISLLTFTAEASAQKVSISLNNVKVEKILSTITKQTGLSVAYSKQIVNLDRRMSIQVEDTDVAQVLEKLVADTNLSYEIKNNKIYLFEKSPTTIPIVAQQKKHITGIVVDQNGDPIIGANVVEKGSSNGTITDIDGNFSLQVSEKSILTVSYIGYETKDVKVGNQSKLQIALSEDTQFIDEVVVVGFGTQKKVNLTGAVSVINSEALEARPVTTATQALQGVLPGLNIGMNNGGGELNNSLEINIRGAGTIGDGSKSSPLVLIDGMDGDINMLNPQDIESVSVLKDAAAASIYGSRASFGVILITTKKGKEGKTNISYNNSFRWSSPMRMPEMMDSYTFANYWNTASTNAHQGVVFDEETMGRIIAFQKGEITTQGVSDPNNPNRYQMYEKGNNNIDWLKEHFKSGAFAQEHNLSVNGGSQKIQFYLSANYLGQEGLLRYGGDDYKRYSFTSKINAQLADWASVNVSTKFLRGDQSQPTYLTENTRLFFNELSRKWPVTPRNYEHGGYTSTSRIIPLEDGGRYKSQNDYLYQQLQLVLEPIKNWKLFGEVNYRVHNKNEHTEILETSELGIDGINSQIEGVAGYAKGLTRITENYYKENFLNTNLYTEYSHTFASGHNLKALVGFNAELSKDRDLKAYKEGLITPSLPTIDTATGLEKIQSGGYDQWATAGFFGRLNYNYNDRYMAELNLRYDGTSRFLEAKRWNWFPSVSAGWNIAREAFMESTNSWLGSLKLRVSYGQLGNQNTESLYPFYSLMNITAGGGNWLLNGAKPDKVLPAALISKYLTWEKVETWNVGLDFGLFNNRLIGSIEGFSRYTKDMVGPAPELPVILGTDVPKMNNADLQTTGWELDLSWRDRLKNGLSYGIHFTVTDARMKVKRYPNENNKVDVKNEDKIYYEGQYIGDIWGYTTIGIAKTDEETNNHLAKVDQSTIGNEWAAGDIMYADLDGDGEINGGQGMLGKMGDKRIIGNKTPRYNFGLTLDASWQGFDISAFFQGTMKRDLWLGDNQFWGASTMWQGIGLKAHEDYFRLANDPMGENLNSYYPRPIFDSEKNRQVQTRYLQSGAYIRLKNLQFGYTLPTEFMQKIAIQKLRVFISGENLWTGTKMSKAFDPEAFAGERGEGRVYPLQTTISLGLSVNF